jgi:hypothetical protein
MWPASAARTEFSSDCTTLLLDLIATFAVMAMATGGRFLARRTRLRDLPE